MASSGAASSASAIPEQRLICRVCMKQFAQYTCPRCNLRYCSLPCYKGHNLRCTETFAQENVMEELKDITVTSENKQRMLEALKRIHFDEQGRSVFEDEELEDVNDKDPDDSGQGVTTLSDETLCKIAEGDLSLEDLSAEEKKSFLRAIAAGKLSHMINPWEPWWAYPLAHGISLTKQGTRLLQPVEEMRIIEPVQLDPTAATGMEMDADAVGSEIPPPPDKSLQSVKELTPVQPSPLLGVHLTQTIYGYCFTLRLFNGDWRSDPLDAALVLLSIARVLGEVLSPESMGAALAECLETVCSPAFKYAGGYRYGVGLFDDTAVLLGLKRPAVICALADMERMLETAKKELKKEIGADRERRRAFTNNDVAPGCKAVDTSDENHVQVGVTEEIGVIQSRVTELKTSSHMQKDNKSSITKQKGKRSLGKYSSDSRRLQAAMKKLYFMMCWANEQPNDIYVSLAGLVEGEKGRLPEGAVGSTVENLVAVDKVKCRENREAGKRPLILEV